LARLQCAIGGPELVERGRELLRRLGELPCPLVHASLQVGVQQLEIVERARVLQRERSLVRERVQERHVAGPEEGAAPGTSEAEDARRKADREAKDLLQTERRAERGAGGRQHLLGVVAAPTEDAVDDALDAVANAGQQEEHRQREDERERGRLADTRELEAVG